MAKLDLIRRDMIEVLKDLPEFCYARNPADGTPILLKRGVQGYWPAKPDSDPFAMNEIMGVNVAQIEAMVAGSLCGFDVPGADPLNYTDSTLFAKLEARYTADKADFASEKKLRELARRYDELPNRGAILTLSGGTIGNGTTVVAQFNDGSAATVALVRCGFRRDGTGWKLSADAEVV